MKNTAFIILLTICFQLPVAGQLKVKQADAKFEKEFYYDAIETYLKVAEKQPAHTHVVTRLADSYRLVNNYPKAKEWYAKAVELPDVQPIAYFNYAEILKTMDMHEESFEWYEKYAATNPDDERVKTMLSDKDFLNTIDIKALYGELNKLDTKHKGSDFGATFMGENRIVFATTRNATSSIDHKNKRENQPFYDLWIADLNGWQPDSLRPMPEGINTPVHEGPAVFSKDGTEIFFTRNSAVQRDRFEQAVNHLMIYHSKFNGSTWSEPVPLPFNSDRYSCGHPALSPDGKILYFVSQTEQCLQLRVDWFEIFFFSPCDQLVPFGVICQIYFSRQFDLQTQKLICGQQIAAIDFSRVQRPGIEHRHQVWYPLCQSQVGIFAICVHVQRVCSGANR